MNKTAKDEIYSHYYNAGVKLAMDKVGNMGTKALISRLRPMGARNIEEGIKHVGLGSMLGAAGTGVASLGAELVPALQGNVPIKDLMTAGTVAGGIAGKLLKDKKTRDLARSLSNAERRAVLSGMGGRGTSVGGAVLAGMGGKLLNVTNPMYSAGLPNLLSEAYTNRAVKNILKGKS